MEEPKNSNLKINEEEISLKELLLKLKEWIDYLMTKWLIIVLAGIIGASLGLVYAIFQKPTYKATLTFALDDEKSAGGGLTSAFGLASSLGIDLGSNAGGAFSGANLIELMKSRTIIEKVLLNKITKNGKTYSLAEYYLDFSKERDNLNKNPNLKNIHFLVDENSASYSVQKDSVLGSIFEKFVGPDGYGALTVTQKDKKVSIISVEVKTKDEIFSKALVEAVVKEVSEFYIYTKSKKARTNVEILQKQADSIRNELNS
ncbi:MAG: lipopolysaccharide biosynthesis protein, partial [Sphingobacteriia bacterium 35-40-5]